MRGMHAFVNHQRAIADVAVKGPDRETKNAGLKAENDFNFPQKNGKGPRP